MKNVNSCFISPLIYVHSLYLKQVTKREMKTLSSQGLSFYVVGNQSADSKIKLFIKR